MAAAGETLRPETVSAAPNQLRKWGLSNAQGNKKGPIYYDHIKKEGSTAQHSLELSAAWERVNAKLNTFETTPL